VLLILTLLLQFENCVDGRQSFRRFTPRNDVSMMTSTSRRLPTTTTTTTIGPLSWSETISANESHRSGVISSCIYATNSGVCFIVSWIHRVHQQDCMIVENDRFLPLSHRNGAIELHQKSALPVVCCRGHLRRSLVRPYIQRRNQIRQIEQNFEYIWNQSVESLVDSVRALSGIRLKFTFFTPAKPALLRMKFNVPRSVWCSVVGGNQYTL
jgi:hypothetical protein